MSQIDNRYLEGLIGYNARRVALVSIGRFLDRMSVFGLRPVDFSILAVVHHNPGITSRELCRTLDLLPPNLVGQVAKFEMRGLIERAPKRTDRRAIGLSLSADGLALMLQTEGVVSELEAQVGNKLTPSERAKLVELLQKVYL